MDLGKNPFADLPSEKAQEDHVALGMEAKAKNRIQDAVKHFQKALAQMPGRADIHFQLAQLLEKNAFLPINLESYAQGPNGAKLLASYRELIESHKAKNDLAAVIALQTQLSRLRPNDLPLLFDLGMMNWRAGRIKPAVESMARCVLAKPDHEPYKAQFSAFISNLQIDGFSKLGRDALMVCLQNPDHANLKLAFRFWYSLIQFDQNGEDMRAAISAAEDGTFDTWAADTEAALDTFASDDFFIAGLSVLPNADHRFEYLVTALRRFLCLHYAEQTTDQKRFDLYLPLITALAAQGFLNEYVTLAQDDEMAVIGDIQEDKPFKDSGPNGAFALALLASYRPLYKHLSDEDMGGVLSAEQLSCLEKLIKMQWREPREERRIAKEIPVLGAIEDDVSGKVQAQYEENPYPRWISASMEKVQGAYTPLDAKQADAPLRILIAGCGTGYQAILSASQYPNAQVTAIDLSRTSLAYAKRKADSLGLSERISFAQADILSLGQAFPEPFDIVESVGVLHHMSDPMAGWRVLADCVKPRGYMYIGLYSALARQNITKARALIAGQGLKDTADDIRAFRRQVMDRPSDDAVRQMLLGMRDFYNLSGTRDLVFHVQEHQMTLPQIDEMLRELSLDLVRFALPDPRMQSVYHQTFPEDQAVTDLKTLHRFEIEYPDTFSGMYMFWVQKKAES